MENNTTTTNTADAKAVPVIPASQMDMAICAAFRDACVKPVAVAKDYTNAALFPAHRMSDYHQTGGGFYGSIAHDIAETWLAMALSHDGFLYTCAGYQPLKEKDYREAQKKLASTEVGKKYLALVAEAVTIAYTYITSTYTKDDVQYDIERPITTKVGSYGRVYAAGRADIVVKSNDRLSIIDFKFGTTKYAKFAQPIDFMMDSDGHSVLKTQLAVYAAGVLQKGPNAEPRTVELVQIMRTTDDEHMTLVKQKTTDGQIKAMMQTMGNTITYATGTAASPACAMCPKKALCGAYWHYLADRLPYGIATTTAEKNGVEELILEAGTAVQAAKDDKKKRYERGEDIGGYGFITDKNGVKKIRREA